MYILRVVTKMASSRYAYGSEKDAMNAYNRWKHCPQLIRAEIFPIGNGKEQREEEPCEHR